MSQTTPTSPRTQQLPPAAPASSPPAKDADVSATRDRIVHLMMVLVSAALGAMLYAQLGYSALSSIVCGVALFASLITGELLKKRASLIEKLRGDVRRLEQELKVDREPAAAAETKPETRSPKLQRTSIEEAPSKISSEAQWEKSQLARTAHLSPPKSSAPAKVPPQPQQNAAVPAASQTAAVRHELVAAPNWSGTSVSATDPLRDAWSFRPREGAEPGLQSVEGRTQPGPSLEFDLDLVQRKIKALAEEVQAVETAKSARPAVEPPSRPQLPFEPAALEIESGIAALRSAAGTMRTPAATSIPEARPVTPESSAAASILPSADSLIPTTAETIAVSMPVQKDLAVPEPAPQQRPTEQVVVAAAPLAPTPIPAPAAPSGDTSILEIAKAIETKRMDVLLSPIVGLSDFAVSHFEVVVRLRDKSGEALDNPEQSLSLAGSHLLAQFDAERLSRAAKVANELEDRGKSGAVLTSTSGQSMSDANFLETLARVYEARNSISGKLVLAFSQADVEAFSSGTWQALTDMHAFGFRFAMQRVTHLGQDFEVLAQKGFAFVKLGAQAFQGGLPQGKGFVQSKDISRHLSRSGMSIVAENVNDEGLLAQIFGFGVLLGQGQLFGEPRTVNVSDEGAQRSAA